MMNDGRSLAIYFHLDSTLIPLCPSYLCFFIPDYFGASSTLDKIFLHMNSIPRPLDFHGDCEVQSPPQLLEADACVPSTQMRSSRPLVGLMISHHETSARDVLAQPSARRPGYVRSFHVRSRGMFNFVFSAGSLP